VAAAPEASSTSSQPAATGSYVPSTTAVPASAGAASSASAPQSANPQPKATGAAAGALIGQPTPKDADLGAYPMVVPVSGAVGAAALGVSLVASRRRPFT
jgi:hypothetical protein